MPETVAGRHPAYQCAEKITELAALYDNRRLFAIAGNWGIRWVARATPPCLASFKGNLITKFGKSLAGLLEPVNRFVVPSDCSGKIGNGECHYKGMKSKKTATICNTYWLWRTRQAPSNGFKEFWAKYESNSSFGIVFRRLCRDEAKGHVLTGAGGDDDERAPR